MIDRPVNGLVFRYDYLPRVNEARLHPQDGGFSVELHQNNTMVLSLYDLNRQPVQCLSYQMPTQMKMDYLALLDKHTDTLNALDRRMMLPEDRQARYWSCFGLEGMDLIMCHDIEQMVRLPFGDPAGRQGRTLCLFFEALCELFLPYGLELSPNTLGLHESMRFMGVPVMQPAHPYQTGTYYQTGAYQQSGTGTYDPAYTQPNAVNY